MIANSIHSDRTQERYWHIVVPLVVTTISNIIAASTLNTAARYLAMMLMPSSFVAAVVILSWAAGSLSQPAVKRAAALALIIAVSNTPNIWTPYLYSKPPRYVNAFAVNIVASVLAIALATATMFYLKRRNKRLGKGVYFEASGPTAKQKAAGFRYIL